MAKSTPATADASMYRPYCCRLKNLDNKILSSCVSTSDNALIPNIPNANLQIPTSAATENRPPADAGIDLENTNINQPAEAIDRTALQAKNATMVGETQTNTAAAPKPRIVAIIAVMTARNTCRCNPMMLL